jgi:hypothetical protein
LRTYDDVVYRAAPRAATVVQRAPVALPNGGTTLVHVRPYPPPTLARWPESGRMEVAEADESDPVPSKDHLASE